MDKQMTVDELLLKISKRCDPEDAQAISAIIAQVRAQSVGKTPEEVAALASASGMYPWLQSYFGSRSAMVNMAKALVWELGMKWSEGKTFF